MTDARILVVRAPQVLSYFNAGHHLALYQVAMYLRDRVAADVRCYDPTVETVTWKDVADDLHTNAYALVVVQNDLDGVDGLERLIRYVRALAPAAKIVSFGRLSAINPAFFRQFDLDAVVESGDPEPAVLAVASAASDGDWASASVAGVAVRHDGRWLDAPAPGHLLDPSDWPLPAPKDIPYDDYESLYSRDGRKFSGIPGRRELVVPVARGCPIGCKYCEVPTLGGRRDRRLNVAQTMRYIDASFAAEPFEYVSFYAPTFTINRRWVRELCDTLTRRATPLRWKCCTTVHHLDEALVTAMGAAGCVRISVGLETLDSGGMAALPPAKRKSQDDLAELAQWCASVGIELTCFVIVGLPGTTVEGTRQTMETVRALGGRVRPTIYAPEERMSAQLTVGEMSRLNRQILHDAVPLTPSEQQDAYELAFGADRPSEVPAAIDRHEARR